MPTLEDILALVTAPMFVPIVVVGLAVILLLVGRARKQSREQLKRANKIESQLRD